MKTNPFIRSLFMFVALSAPILASAAPNISGSWKGAVRKISGAACSVPSNAVLKIVQCKVGSSPGNLFSGTLSVGTDSIKIVGRIDPDNNFRAIGKDISIATRSAKSALLIGKFVPGSSKIQINEFEFTSTDNASSSLLNEMYDVITLSK